MIDNVKSLPVDLFSQEQVRAFDQKAIKDAGIAGIVLMKRAGRSAFAALTERWPNTRKISVWCGAGNNAGDGYILAGLALNSGMEVQLVQVGSQESLKGDAKLAHDWAIAQGLRFTPVRDLKNIEGDVLVDALLGTGLAGELRPPYAKAIELINAHDAPVLAIDIPSGLDGDTGAVNGRAVVAELTVTFIGVKPGLLTACGPAYSGELRYDDLGVPAQVFESATAVAQRVALEQYHHLLAPRKRTAHKGNFGHVLIVGGNLGMGGAALMAAQAAGRAGAGLVSVATRPEHLAALLARCPEAMAHGINSGQDLEPLLERANAIVIGPGLGRNAWSEQMLRVVLTSSATLVVDADALNLIGGDDGHDYHRSNWLLTPHPGEAARLLGRSVTDIQSDRFNSVRDIQSRFGGVAILKGAGTLVAADNTGPVAVCSQGNPGMASGGMGDVLSGILGGLLAQGLSQQEAARLGVCLHAAAADLAANEGERGMMATDLLNYIRRLVNPGQSI